MCVSLTVGDILQKKYTLCNSLARYLKVPWEGVEPSIPVRGT